MPVKWPKLYMDSTKRETHAVEWGKPPKAGEKYYYGNKNESIWAKEIHKKAMNTSENLYLLQIQRGTHKSLPLYERTHGSFKTPEILEYTAKPLHRTKGHRSQQWTVNRKEENMHASISTLKDINEQLLHELAEVRGGLNKAGEALDELEFSTFGRSMKNRTYKPRGWSRPSSANLTRSASVRSTPLRNRPRSASAQSTQRFH